MKRCLLLIFFVTFISQAQIVNIPDANFKTILLEASPSEYIAQDVDGNNFAIDSNNDNEIQESEALEVYTLSLHSANISDVTGLDYFTNLRVLSLYDNNISVLQLNTLTSLEHLRCDFNQITSLDFTGLINLESVICSNNQITSLDFSGNPLFSLLGCFNNPPLTSINVKNGYDDLYPDVDWDYGNPNLSFVCVDNDEFLIALSNVNYSSTIAVNSYCSFTPGGDFNTITGNILFDSNTDGCDPTDLPISSVNLTISNGTEDGMFSSSLSGAYEFYTQSGNFEITPIIENPLWFTISPNSASVLFLDNLNNIQTQDFCITPIGVHNDVEVVFNPTSWARPAYNSSYKVVYTNNGNQTLSGDLVLTFDDNTLDFLSASINPDSINFGTLSWDYSNLTPFESRAIIINFDLNSPTDSPPLNQGSLLSFNVTINPISGDEIPLNNTYSYQQTVVNAFDPNDITCLEGTIVDPVMIGEYLHYNIRFENTGTAAATFVVIANEIDETQYDLTTLQLLNGSHDMTTRITGNKIEFIFDDINLPPLGQGNVLYKIKTRGNLNVGDSVAQQANIYFDYNFPIETNVAATSFETLSVNEVGFENTFEMYPNPAKPKIVIKGSSNIQVVNIFDIHGRSTLVKQINNTTADIDISSLSSGVYFVEIKNEKGSSIQKLIKN